MRWSRPTAALFAVALLLACACVVGGVLVVTEHQRRVDASPASRAPSAAEQERYGDVVKAADATAAAFVNLDYRDPQKNFDAVAATATGTFLTQYKKSSSSLVKLVTSYKSELVGSVKESAVEDVDADSATVLVATEGTVRNAQTGQDSQVRNFRLVIGLVRQKDGRWLTDTLDFAE